MPHHAIIESVPPHVSDLPPDFIPLSQPTHAWLDRKLGYFGQDRFVLFYYEPRGQEVIWKDRTGYGFASGAWCIFLDQVAPLTDSYKVDLGLNQGTTHVLLIDRATRRAYFAERRCAEQFLAATAR